MSEEDEGVHRNVDEEGGGSQHQHPGEQHDRKRQERGNEEHPVGHRRSAADLAHAGVALAPPHLAGVEDAGDTARA